MSELLEGLARRWRRRHLARAGSRMVACLLPAAALAWTFGGAWRGLWLGLVGLVAASAGAWLWQRTRQRGRAESVARHLDRTRTEAEDSSGLLLRSEGELTLVGRLQRERVERALSDLLPDDAVARVGWRSAGLWLAASAGAAIAIVVAEPRLQGVATALTTPSELRVATAETLTEGPVRSVEVKVRPPAYTGRPERSLDRLEIEAEEGARLTWTVELDGSAERVALLLDEVTRIDLREADGGRWSGGLSLRAPHVYVLEVERPGAGPWRSPYSRLQVLPDAAPSVELVRPEADLDLPAGRPGSLTLEAEAEDDYGLGDAEVVATLAAGAGESVRFRERRLALGRSLSGSGESQRFLRTLDLVAMGLERGAELYLHVEVTDRRAPGPQRARSRTVRVRMAGGPGGSVGLGSGLPILPLPEFFRSQRQIILDTEKLLADGDELTEAEFRRRSEAIGFDQRALRFRYAGLLGEEFVSGVALGDDVEGDFEEFEDPESGSQTIAELLEELPVGAVHEHDAEAIDTFFDDEVKELLRASLREMWGAEGRLRSIDPQRALPHEYRALRHLKSAQEAERVYVRRVGFEPPPIFESDKRLTGELDDVESQAVSAEAAAAGLDPVLVRAFEALESLRAGGPVPDGLEESLAGARRALVARRGVGPEDLAALEVLTELLAPGERQSRPSASDLDVVEGALWGLLPEPEGSPRPGAGESALMRDYLRRLEEGG